MAAVEQVDYDLGSYQDEYLDCRDHGHSWQVHGKWRDAFGDWNRRLECANCKMRRHDRYVAGEVRRSYDAPDGYYLTERIDRWAFKYEALDRTPTFSSEEELDTSLKARRRTKKNGQQSGKEVDLRERSARGTRQKVASR